jgi:hypothetical protein
MSDLKTRNPVALRLLMTDDIYCIGNQTEKSSLKTANESSDLPSFSYMGENNKYILILINEQKQEIISQEDLGTLTSILTARQLEIRDVAIVNLDKHPAKDFNQLKQFFACKKLILFGINPMEIGLNEINSNEPELVKDTKILATFTFDEMRNDNSKKRLFWNAMKQL